MTHFTYYWALPGKKIVSFQENIALFSVNLFLDELWKREKLQLSDTSWPSLHLKRRENIKKFEKRKRKTRKYENRDFPGDEDVNKYSLRHFQGLSIFQFKIQEILELFKNSTIFTTFLLYYSTGVVQGPFKLIRKSRNWWESTVNSRDGDFANGAVQNGCV